MHFREIVLSGLIVAVLLAPGYLYAAEPHWTQVSLRSEKQKEMGLKGGEGFQMTMSIAYSKSKPAVVYFSSDTAQIWKSVDEGRSWTSMHAGFDAHGARSIFVDPVNPDVIFAAAFLGKTYDDAKNKKSKAEGIYMSVDGARSWKKVYDTGFYRQEETRGNIFACDSRSVKDGRTRVLFAGSYNDGLLRSQDFGKSWESVGLAGKPISAVVEDPDAFGDMYVATEKGLFVWRNGIVQPLGMRLPDWPRSIAASPKGVLYTVAGEGGVFKSTDRGKSFSKLMLGLPLGQKFTDVAVSLVDPNVVYVKPSEGLFHGPYFSHNAGQNWHSADSWNKGGIISHEKLFWFSGPIVPHPTDPLKALIASNGKGMILRTNDGGKNWEYSASGFTGGRMTDIAFLDERTMLFGLFDHGVFLSEDGGDTFLNLSSAFPSAKQTILACAGDKNVLVTVVEPLAGSSYLGVSNDRGRRWNYFKRCSKFPQPAFAAFATGGNTIYAGYYRSDDRGASWKELRYAVAAILKGRRDIVYTVEDRHDGQCQVMRSDDKGETWPIVLPALPFSKSLITDIAISPEDSNRIYVAANWKGLWVLESGQWRQVGPRQIPEANSMGKNVVKLVEIDPANPQRIVMGTWAPGMGQGNGVFESIDGAWSFHNITGDIGPELSVWGLKISPFDGAVYVGTSRGTYKLGMSGSSAYH